MMDTNSFCVLNGFGGRDSWEANFTACLLTKRSSKYFGLVSMSVLIGGGSSTLAKKSSFRY